LSWQTSLQPQRLPSYLRGPPPIAASLGPGNPRGSAARGRLRKKRASFVFLWASGQDQGALVTHVSARQTHSRMGWGPSPGSVGIGGDRREGGELALRGAFWGPSLRRIPRRIFVARGFGAFGGNRLVCRWCFPALGNFDFLHLGKGHYRGSEFGQVGKKIRRPKKTTASIKNGAPTMRSERGGGQKKLLDLDFAQKARASRGQGIGGQQKGDVRGIDSSPFSSSSFPSFPLVSSFFNKVEKVGRRPRDETVC